MKEIDRYFEEEMSGQSRREIKIEFTQEEQQALGFYFVKKKEPRVWWSRGHGGEFKVHTDFVVSEDGNLKEILKEIMDRAEVFDRGSAVIHFDISIGPME